MQAMGLPLYWKATLFRACQDGDPTPTDTAATVSLPGLRKTWQRLVLGREREREGVSSGLRTPVSEVHSFFVKAWYIQTTHLLYRAYKMKEKVEWILTLYVRT